MNKRQTNLHRGQLLEDAVKATRLKKEEVAGRAGYQRTSYYKHIKEPELPFHILAAYGRAIRYDFTEWLPEMPKYMIEDPPADYTGPITIDEARKQMEYWKTKYIELLEQFNRLAIEFRNETMH